MTGPTPLQNFEWNTASSLIAGVLGGIATTLTWELLGRPWRERRHVAKVLEAEISINLKLCVMQSESFKRAPRRLPADLKMSLLMFEALRERIGELPHQLLGEVVLLYLTCERLNEEVRAFAALYDAREQLTPNDPRRTRVESELAQTLAVTHGTVETIIERASVVQPKLFVFSRPLWRRVLRLDRMQMGNREEMGNAAADHERALGHVKERLRETP